MSAIGTTAVFDSSPLDPLETTVEIPAVAPQELAQVDLLDTPWNEPRRDLDAVNFRHSGWHQTRKRVFAALLESNCGENRLERFDLCGNNAWVMRSLEDPSVLKITSNKCHDRFCLPCASDRSRTIARNVVSHLGTKHARLITLTLRANESPLVATLARLTACFSRLRNTRLWRVGVSGGVSFIEIKRSERHHTWNCHVHAIAEGRYVAKERLAKAWKRITGDSFIVDIRFVADLEKVARYVTKYASKPLDPSVTRDPNHLLEAVQALKGKHLCSTFGDWHDLSLTDKPPEGDWECVAPLDALIRESDSGDPKAIAIIAQLRRLQPCHTRGPPKTCSTRSTRPGTGESSCVAPLCVQTVLAF